MREIADRFCAQVGCVLLTVTRVEPEHRTTVIRVWSSHPAVYPLHASKPLDNDDWMAIVTQRRPVVCNQPAELDALFPADAECLQSLGCGAGINLPVFDGDVLLGSVNAFHQAGWFTPERVARAETLAADFFRNTP